MRRVPVLVLFLAAAGPASARPDDPRALHGRARAEALRGRCESADSLVETLRASHATYYAERVARDPVVARCRGAAAGPLPPAHRRFGIDTLAAVGLVLTAGAGVRYEHPLGEQTALVGRAIGVTGAVFESEDNGFDAIVPLVGARRYSATGRSYLVAEAGLAVVRTRAHPDPFDDVVHPAVWSAVPAAQLGFGFKLGRIDLSFAGTIPFFGVAAQLGLDLGSF